MNIKKVLELYVELYSYSPFADTWQIGVCESSDVVYA